MESAELFLRSIVETANAAIITSDSGGNITSWNQAAVDIFGYSHDEIIGKPLITIMPKRFHEAHQKGMKRVTATGKSHIIGSTVEILGLRKDGTEIPLELSLAKWTSKDGQFFTAIIRDITKHKQAEGVLKESEEKFSRAFHSNPHPMSIVTMAEGRYLDVNDSYVQTFGFSREELLGRTTVEMGITKTGGFREIILESLKENQTVKNLELELYTRSGRKVEALLSSDKMEIGGQACLLSVITDITERKQIEHNLGERFKELNCLYGIAETVGRLGITLDEILQETVNLIPPSWQYPEVTCTRIKLADKEFKADNFKPSQWRQSADIVVNGQKEGTLEVYYLVKKPESDEGPFLKEERLLINAIAERLGGITERKRAEGALRESEERFSQLYNESPVGYHELDKEGRIVQVNQTELDMLGYTAEEMLGKHVWDFMVETDTSRQALAAKMAGTMPPGQAFERTYHRKDGTTFPVLIEDRYVKDESGQIIGLRSTIQDITEHKRAEEEIKRTRDYLEKLNNSLEEVIFNVTFPGRTIEYVNRAVETVLGYRPDECIGQNTEFLFKSNKDYLEVGRKLSSAIENNKPGLELEFQVRNKDGEAVDVDINLTFIKEQGELTRVISVFRDVTERKQAEEKRIQLIQELQETLKEVRTLSGLLPICAWCKKLRDDEGYWKSVEQYIGERTKAKFTHGMCPECQRKFLSEKNSNTKVS